MFKKKPKPFYESLFKPITLIAGDSLQFRVHLWNKVESLRIQRTLVVDKPTKVNHVAFFKNQKYAGIKNAYIMVVGYRK